MSKKHVCDYAVYKDEACLHECQGHCSMGKVALFYAQKHLLSPFSLYSEIKEYL